MTILSAGTLGRLTRVELREAWQGEATYFTPWLAQPDNISLLGDAIGVELEVESQEKNVGPFRADILCKDTVSNHYVLIENQLERTDHTHMGQLITYAAGLEAVTIVWVASRFTEEHRAALDWLNSITRPDINFFGLEIELWRIGDSPMAPKFNVVSKPNDWSKVVREQAAAATNSELSESQRLHLQFWTQFRQYLDDNQIPIRINRPWKEFWSTVGLGRGGFSLSPWNGMRDNRSAVDMVFTGRSAKAHYSMTEQRHRATVQEKLAPMGNVVWRPMPEAKQSMIRLERPSMPSKPETWPELNEWMARALSVMQELFSPIVKTLNAGEYVQDSGEPAELDLTPTDSGRGE